MESRDAIHVPPELARALVLENSGNSGKLFLQRYKREAAVLSFVIEVGGEKGYAKRRGGRDYVEPKWFASFLSAPVASCKVCWVIPALWEQGKKRSQIRARGN